MCDLGPRALILIRGVPRGARRELRVQLGAVSPAGRWLKTDGYLEFLDPITGTTQAFCQVDDDEEACFLEPSAAWSVLGVCGRLQEHFPAPCAAQSEFQTPATEKRRT